jgi:hypothetical protein
MRAPIPASAGIASLDWGGRRVAEKATLETVSANETVRGDLIDQELGRSDELGTSIWITAKS